MRGLNELFQRISTVEPFVRAVPGWALQALLLGSK